jgi:glycosyltransferase involved in cell wall biosynthesis
MKNLLVVSQPQEAGVPRHVLELLAGLHGRWRITVACPRDSELWQGVERLPGVERVPIAAARRPSLADLSTLAALLPRVRRADVVHGHSSKAGFLVRLAALLTGRRRRCVFTPHGWSWWAFSGWQARLYRGLERRAAPWGRAILAVSAHERDAALACRVGRPQQYRVVRNGVSLQDFAAPPCPQPGRAVMVGRFDAPKRHDTAVRAFALLRARMPEATLDLVGDGPLRARTEALAAQLGVAGAVRFLGQRRDVPALLARASCLLLASDYEGCPLTVLEGMAAGLPVVATRFGGIEELVDHGRTGRIAAPDPESVAAALAAVLGDPTAARAMGDAARAEAQARFSRERMVAEVEAVYAEVLAG